MPQGNNSTAAGPRTMALTHAQRHSRVVLQQHRGSAKKTRRLLYFQQEAAALLAPGALAFALPQGKATASAHSLARSQACRHSTMRLQDIDDKYDFTS
ncbi:hypothetical protein [Janthinobacterium sp. AD80]|uniref:hypothetical protein n=1 Tax=Janthinobacterium sp. AD80 TaxID=1528773 RepID=UPI0015E0EC4C|nr:hypothetical protein [Janthinobacterium sp. AD80]